MMRGPGPKMRGDGRMAHNVKGTIRRLLGYVARYKLRLVLVLVCIVGNAVASVVSASFIRVLIDDHIAPMLLSAQPAFGGLAMALVRMACIYLVGIACGLLYNRIMVTVALFSFAKRTRSASRSMVGWR